MIEALEAHLVGYAVCGGLAVAIHGFPRFTKDIDLLVLSDDIQRIKAILDGIGFSHEAAPMIFRAGTYREALIHRVSKIDGADLLTVDLIEARGWLVEVFHSRRAFEWRSHRLQVVSREGLTAMKTATGREQDEVDLSRLGLKKNGG